MCIPDIVGDSVGGCLSFFNVARGKEASPNRLGASEVCCFAVPEAATGRVGRDVLPHVSGKPIPNPEEIGGTVDSVGHAHVSGNDLDVVGVSSEPVDRVGRADA